MGWMMVLILLLLLLLLLIELGAEAFVFHLPSGRTRCISEDFRLGAVSVAHYRIVFDEDAASGDQKISVRVSDPYGDSVHQTEGVESGLFAFTAAHTGQYTACFWSPHFRHSSSLSINFDWKSGVAAKDWTRVAKREKLDGMEMELKKLEDSAHAIHEEMIFLRKREEEMQELIQSTNSKMGLLSMFSLFICLSVAGLQLWHLKNFFVSQKIL